MKRHVFIEKTSKYISVRSYLIGRFRLPDFKNEILYLETNVSMEVLGKSIDRKLYESRQIPETEFMELWSNRKEFEKFNELENKKIIREYGYKNKREICKDALFLNVSIYNDNIHITPSHQDGLCTYTTAIDKNGDSVEFEYPVNLSYKELGEAVMKGFEYCTSIYK